MLTTLKNWYKSTETNCDALELEQSAIRLGIGASFSLYILFAFYSNNPFSRHEIIGSYCLVAFNLLAAVLFMIISHANSPSRVRRLLGNWLDIIGTTVFLSLSDEIGAILIGAYLWITFSNGFRFGKKYLYHSQAISILGFLIAMYINPYWENHQSIMVGFFLMLLLLPPYIASLITRLNEVKLSAEIATARAESANLARTKLIANISHEIRTSLNGIIGIHSLLISTPLNDKQQNMLKALESSSKLLLSLLNNVLDFTKIEEHKLNIENVTFSVNKAIQETAEMFRIQCVEKELQLHCSIGGGLEFIKGDVVILRQVLTNLMGNALKFTQKGSINISAINVDDQETKATIRFEIADTGIGIPAAQQHKVFESFTQTNSATTRQFSGSGLGLAIAKDMIQAMGGKLEFNSIENIGTRFWFDLSLTKDLTITNASEKTTTPDTGNNDQIYQIKPLDILICEDEKTNQCIIKQLLSLPGHHANVVDSSEDMLDLLAEKQFDLVITDLNMAGINGINAIKLYRFTHPEDTKTRFILFTADASLATKQEAYNAGFDSVLTKPIEASTLYASVEKTLHLPSDIAKHWVDEFLNINKPSTTINQGLTEQDTVLDINTIKELEKIGSGDKLFMYRLLRNYLTDTSTMLNQLSSLALQEHYIQMKESCHALKGNSLSIGATQMALSANRLSEVSSAETTRAMQQQLDTLQHHFSALINEIESYLKRPVLAYK